jgi:hypothetical protein
MIGSAPKRSLEWRRSAEPTILRTKCFIFVQSSRLIVLAIILLLGMLRVA